MLEVTMKNKYTKFAAIALLPIAIVATLYIFMAQKYSIWPYNYSQTNSTAQATTPTTDNTPVPSGSTVAKDQETTTSGSDPSPAPITPPNGGKSTVGVILSATNKTDSTLQVRAIIQNVTNTGECTLILKKQGTETIRTYKVGVQASSSTSTCKGFDIPLSELSTGTWELSLIFENDSLRGETSKDVII